MPARTSSLPSAARASGGIDPTALRPLETINLLALAAVSFLTVLLDRRLADPGGLLRRYAIMAAGLGIVAALVRRERRLPVFVRFLLDFYPAAFIPVLYETLGVLIFAARGGARDDLLIAADRALFGVDVTVWLERFVRPWLTNLFYAAYTTYYFISLCLGFVLWRRNIPALRRYIFTLTLCYYVSYAGYFAIPALGPRFALASRQTVVLESTRMAAGIERTLDQLEHTKLDAFPSGHTMLAAAVLLVAFRRARDVFWWLLPVATCLILSTVYCRYHYVVDVLAGLVLAAITVPVGDWIYGKLTRRVER
ncbi:MAG: phosphatase PAP2 family protein [Acidobacteriota bacterium]